MHNKEILTKLNQYYKLPESVLNNINTDIYPDDDMFNKGEEEHYFNVGFSCMEIILNTLRSENINTGEIKTILDFPCGYGRELRFMKAYFPEAVIYGCELPEEKLKYVRDNFAAETFASKRDFQKINVDKKFDLIWCGSLFTHISARRFRKLLSFFNDHLTENGLLFFTTHGRYSAKILNTYGLRSVQRIYIKAKYNITGFGYNSYIKQFAYGVSLSDPSWVLKCIQKYDDLRAIGISEKKWDNHQDVVICRKKNIMK